MADVLSEDQINEIQEAFTKVDTDTDGVISTADLGQCLRLLGQNPTIAEIQASLFFAHVTSKIFQFSRQNRMRVENHFLSKM